MRVVLALSLLGLLGSTASVQPVEPLSHEDPAYSATGERELIRTAVTVSEARRAGVPVEIALAVTRHEVRNADSLARGRAGEVGYFQVMPQYWKNSFLDCYPDRPLQNPERNACIGVHILRLKYAQHGTWDKALRAYNGSLHFKALGDQYVSGVNSQLEKVYGSD